MLSKNKIFPKLLVAICISAFFVSCSSDKNTWDIAKVNNDIISYEYYIEEYPKGQYIDSAKDLIENILIQYEQTPPPLIQKIVPPIAIWDNTVIDSLSLQISISAWQSKEYELEKESQYYNFIKDVLDEIGIIVVPQDVKFKTNLKINLKVQALREYYQGMGYQYRGYKLEGEISLTKKGKKPILLSINKNKPCPPVITYIQEHKNSEIKKWGNPENKLNTVNAEMFFRDYFYKVWGPSPLLWLDTYRRPVPPELRNDYEGDLSKDLINNIIRACYSDKNEIKYKAMELFLLTNSDTKMSLSVVLHDINKSARFSQIRMPEIEFIILETVGSSAIEAVPSLIHLAENRLKRDWSENQIKSILDALESITNENFKTDIRSWKKWWFDNKQNLLDE